MKPFIHFSAFLLTAVFSVDSMSEDWLGFRGSLGSGESRDRGFPTEWSPTKNVKWRTPLSETGNGSPIVVGDKIFLQSADAEGLERSLMCFNRSNGKVDWQRSVAFGTKEATHKTNPFSPSTPVSDGQRIYVWHGSAGMFAYTMSGEPVWSRELGTFHHIWGLGASPVIVGELVVQLCGPGERTFVAALKRSSGEIVWQTPMELGGSDSSKGRYVGSWATPRLIQIGETEQLVVCFHSRVVGLDPKTGRELWSIDGLSNERSDLCYAGPAVAGNNVVIMGGYGGPEFGFEIESDGRVSESSRLWRNLKLDGNKFHPQRIGSGVTVGNLLYMADANEQGTIECLDMTSGHRLWLEPRTSDGPHWGSIVLAEGRLYVPGQKGLTRVLQATSERYQVIAENDLGEQCNATPAFSNGEIFIRTFDALYAIADE